MEPYRWTPLASPCHNASPQGWCHMEVGQSPIATFKSHPSFPDAHAVSTLCCAGGRGGLIMARHKHISVGDAKVCPPAVPQPSKKTSKYIWLILGPLEPVSTVGARQSHRCKCPSTSRPTGAHISRRPSSSTTTLPSRSTLPPSIT